MSVARNHGRGVLRGALALPQRLDVLAVDPRQQVDAAVGLRLAFENEFRLRDIDIDFLQQPRERREGETLGDQNPQGDLPILPRRPTIVLTCLDSRVDPAHFLGLELGDALVLRNTGGRDVNATYEV